MASGDAERPGELLMYCNALSNYLQQLASMPKSHFFRYLFTGTFTRKNGERCQSRPAVGSIFELKELGWVIEVPFYLFFQFLTILKNSIPC